MYWTVWPMVLLLNACVSTDGQVSMNPIPRLLMDTITYYDMFGDEVGMAYYDGYVQVECEIGPSLYVCTLDQVHLIDPDGEIAFTTSCNDRVTLRLDINENTTFGEYKCQYKNESSSETLPYDYRFCAPEASEAELVACKGCPLYEHCVVTAKGVDKCHEIFESWCLSNETGVTYCTVDGEGPRGSSLCKALRSHRSFTEVHSRGNGDNFCFKDKSGKGELYRDAGIFWYAERQISSRPVAYNSRLIVLTKLKPIDPYAPNKEIDVKDMYDYSVARVQCPGRWDEPDTLHKGTCMIVKTNGEIIETQKFDDCGRKKYDMSYIFNHSAFMDDQFEFYKFKCLFDNGTAVVARTQNYIVEFGIGLNASIHKTKKPTGNRSDDRYTKLECRLIVSPFPPHPFQIKWRWYLNRYTEREEDRVYLNKDNASILSVRVPGKYWCEAAISYRTCSRDPTYRDVEMLVMSENVTAVPVAGAPPKQLRTAEFVLLTLYSTFSFLVNN